MDRLIAAALTCPLPREHSHSFVAWIIPSPSTACKVDHFTPPRNVSSPPSTPFAFPFFRRSSTISCAFTGGTPVGIVYGTGYNSSESALRLLRSQQVTKVRLLNADAAVLQAFANTGIDVMVGVPNQEVKGIGESRLAALKWVQTNVLTHISGTSITAIAVGNEVVSHDPNLAAYLVPACQNVHAALHHFGLDAHIKVSAPQSMSLLESTFPPSSSRFNRTYSSSILRPFLKFLRRSGSFFMVNVYPVQFYERVMHEFDVNFALLQPNRGFYDSKASLHYSNIFDALVDALVTAMAALDFGDIQVVVTETGWCRKEQADVATSGTKNAAIYVSNLKAHLLSGIGTPLKPGLSIITFLNGMVNEEDMLAPSYVMNWHPFQLSGSPSDCNAVAQSEQVSVHSSFDKTWCVGKEYATPDALQAALDWACGFGGADCGPIQLGNPCFVPNNVYSHASYAFNSYYQIHQHASGTCDFGGTATVTYDDPSYPGCSYPFRAGQVGAPVGGASRKSFDFEDLWLLTSLLLPIYLL